MTSPAIFGSAWFCALIATLSGLCIPFALAPYNLWPLALLAPALLFAALTQASARQALLRAFLSGLACFGSGTSWVFISIHTFGHTPIPLALVMTSMFVGFLALVFAVPFYFYAKFFRRTLLTSIFAFCAIWCLGEWLRSWFLTGFPWLYLGYAHTDTWLAGWAPVFGVFGLSLITTLSGVAIFALGLRAYLSRGNASAKQGLWRFAIPSVLCVFIWAFGAWLRPVSWTKEMQSETLQTAIVQPNIPLEQKWDPRYRDKIIQTLYRLTVPHWDADLIIWPEAALPMMYFEAGNIIKEINQYATARDTALLLGALYDANPAEDIFYNSIIGLGKAEGIYFKQRLVPFGEYVPLEKQLRGLIEFFDLPNSIIASGPERQEILKTNAHGIATSICYEVVYPDLVSKYAADANYLVTISNDAWFGDSIGPLQHFQMARMRAIENDKAMIRATNTGKSAIISNKGVVGASKPQFTEVTIRGEIMPRSGLTPFNRWGSIPVVLLCIAILIWALFRGEEVSRVNDDFEEYKNTH